MTEEGAASMLDQNMKVMNNTTVNTNCVDGHGITDHMLFGNTTQPTGMTSHDEGSLYMANWLVVVLIGGTVVVFIAGLIIKRQQMMKDRQRREEQYLAYFHSVLPHSRLYGKIESAGETDEYKQIDKTKPDQDVVCNDYSDFTTGKGLKEILYGLQNLNSLNENDNKEQSNVRENKRVHEIRHEHDNKKEKKSMIKSVVHENGESSSRLNIARPDIAISIECDVHSGKRGKKREKEMGEVIGLTDMTIHKGHNETGIALYSSVTSRDKVQESSYIIWI